MTMKITKHLVLTPHFVYRSGHLHARTSDFNSGNDGVQEARDVPELVFKYPFPYELHVNDRERKNMGGSGSHIE